MFEQGLHVFVPSLYYAAGQVLNVAHDAPPTRAYVFARQLHAPFARVKVDEQAVQAAGEVQ